MDSGERRVGPGKPSWSDLPIVLMAVIMSKLQGQAGLAAVALLRLVCKAWHAAFREYPATVDWQMQDPDDLTHLCKLLPALARLEVHDVNLDTDLQPVSMCTNLTQLRLDGDPDASADLSLLPWSLKELTMDGILPYSAEGQHYSGLKLTKLEVIGPILAQDDGFSQWHLLPYLQDLKVLRLGVDNDVDDNDFQFAFGDALTGLAAMTRLKLCSGYLIDQDTKPHGLSGLQTLELEQVTVDLQWLEKFSFLLPGLTSLELHRNSAWKDPAPVSPIASLRSLVLHSSSDELLCPAPDSLNSLSLRLGLDRELHQPNIAAIARLTAITQLELIGYSGGFDDPSTLFRLDLIELVLIDSEDMVYFFFAIEPDLQNGNLGFVPRLSFRRLQRLHVEDNDPTMLPMQIEKWEPEKVQQLVDQAKEVIFALPNLQQLSGASYLFLNAQQQYLQYWHRLPFQRHHMTDFALVSNAEMAIWKKPTYLP